MVKGRLDCIESYIGALVLIKCLDYLVNTAVNIKRVVQVGALLTQECLQRIILPKVIELGLCTARKRHNLRGQGMKIANLCVNLLNALDQGDVLAHDFCLTLILAFFQFGLV